jgi:predicted nucleic acid-binding protein
LIVLDCSTTIAWALDEDASPRAGGVIRINAGDGVMVPPIWRLEVANVLLQGERRGRHTRADTARALEIIDGLEIVVDGEAGRGAFGRVLELAREHGLTTYDAAYLATAIRNRLPLATLDRRLSAAAEACGVAVL